MSAGGFTKLAKRKGRGGIKRRLALSRLNTCSCHPKQWGRKKGLRRARRRLEREIVSQDLRETEETL